MRTDIGNAFVSGTLRAEDPVSLPEIDGEYAYIKKVEERYTKHTRTVTDYDEDGNVCGSHEETYYTWDAVGHEDYACSQITFLDHAFEYGTVDFPSARYLKTIKESSKLRYAYYVTETESDMYIPISSNLFGIENSIDLRSWVDETQILDLDTSNFGIVFQDYLTTYRNFVFSAYVKTEIDKDHQSKGNYGLILNLPFIQTGAAIIIENL